MSGLDSLESPEIVLVEGHRFGISSSEALSNPGIVEALSVAKAKEANESADNTAKEQAWEGEHDVGIEGDGVKASLSAEVPPAEGGSSKGRAEEGVATEDLEVGRIAQTNMEDVGVVLDEINRSNSEGQVLIGLLNSVRIGVLVMVVAIVTHIY